MVFSQLGSVAVATVMVSWLSLAASRDVEAEAGLGSGVDGPVSTLTSERDAYHVGEPLHLKLVVRNDGAAAVKGFFAYAGGSPEVYRGVKGGRLVKFALRSKAEELRTQAINIARMPVLLEGHDQFESSVYLLLDGETGQFALDAPGEHDFLVVLHPLPSDRRVALSSNRLTVAVKPVPAGEADAFADYQTTTAVVGSARAAKGGDRAAIDNAAGFLSRHPASLYAGHVRETLVRILRNRIAEGTASPEDRTMYESLFQAEPSGR
jgi:hypothetical protein